MSFNSNNLGKETVHKFNLLGNHVIDSLIDIATPIITNASGINVEQKKINEKTYSHIQETDNDIKILVSLPGVKKDNINVILKSKNIDISATTTMSDDGWEHIKEKKFKESFNIPNNITNNDLSLKFENGILKITIDKQNTSDLDGEKINF